MTSSGPFVLADGEIKLWLDSGVIMLRAKERHGDPVELTEHEARQLAERLLDLVSQSEALR